MIAIEADFEIREQHGYARIRINPLQSVEYEPLDIDDLYHEDEDGGPCLIYHK